MTIPTQEHQQEPPPEGLAEVNDLMQVIVKGVRAIQLYLPNNPVYQRALENIRTAFGPVWEMTDELELHVHETDLLWDGQKVLSQDNKSDSLPWLLYKDGVRRVSVSPGAEEEEIVRLLQVLGRARTLEPDSDDDLLTLLWDQDFHAIKYDYVELGMDEIPRLEPSEEQPSEPPEQVHQQVQEEVEEAAPQGIVSIDDFDSTLYFLDEKEIQYLKDEIEREYTQDLKGNVLNMLFDLFELQTYSTVRSELVSIVQNFIPYLLAVGDFRSVALVLRELEVVLQRARDLMPEHRELLEGLPDTLSEAEALGQLLQSLDEAAVHPTEEELGALFRELRPAALTSILVWLPKLANERVRSLLHGAAARLAKAYPQELVNSFEQEDEAVLIETVLLAEQLRLPPLVPPLGALFARSGPPVRRAAAKALAAMGSPGAMQQLEQAIGDDDREVRVTAVRAIGAKRHRAAIDAIEEVVAGRKLRDADLTEKTAFFEAYALLAGGEGMKRLKDLLEPKGLLRRKEDPQIRACAAMALGRINTPDAREVLQRATADKDALVRNAAQRALQGDARA